MGSSGAFTVCLLKALALARGSSITPGALAEAACEIEIDILGEPVGKQDQYVAAHGGICTYTFHRDDTVDVEPLELDPTTLRRLRDNLLLFYTGDARSASAVLADQDARSKAGRRARCSTTSTAPRRSGFRSAELLRGGDLDGYAELMHEHWQNKRRRSPGMANEHIDHLYTWPGARRASAASSSAPAGRVPARLRPPARRHPSGDGRRGCTELVFDFEFSGAYAGEHT